MACLKRWNPKARATEKLSVEEGTIELLKPFCKGRHERMSVYVSRLVREAITGGGPVQELGRLEVLCAERGLDVAGVLAAAVGNASREKKSLEVLPEGRLTPDPWTLPPFWSRPKF